MEWKQSLHDKIAEKEAEGGFPRGELSKFLESFAKENDIGISAVQHFYYNEIKKKPEGELGVPSVGDLVVLEITGLADYGAFGVLRENPKLSGLIHITQISTKFVDNPARHFKLGDIVEAKVLKMDDDGKFAFSTREFDLPDYFAQGAAAEYHSEEDSKETRDIFEYVEKHVHLLSPAAKEKLKALIKKHGTFKFAMALSKALPDLDSDLGVILANEIERKIGDGL